MSTVAVCAMAIAEYYIVDSKQVYTLYEFIQLLMLGAFAMFMLITSVIVEINSIPFEWVVVGIGALIFPAAVALVAFFTFKMLMMCINKI